MSFWEVPEIQNQETLTLTIVVTATAPGLGANVITITGSETYDPILQNQHLPYSHKSTTS